MPTLIAAGAQFERELIWSDSAKAWLGPRRPAGTKVRAPTARVKLDQVR
jgi:hypothetical protein